MALSLVCGVFPEDRAKEWVVSDISISISPVELVLFSWVLGWPGLIVGGTIGALLWRKRRILGGVLGAIVGNFIVFGVR
jgi:putative Mn2+ efflux pump MntP